MQPRGPKVHSGSATAAVKLRGWTRDRLGPMLFALLAMVARAMVARLRQYLLAAAQRIAALLAAGNRLALALEARAARLRTVFGPVPCRSGPLLALHTASNAPNPSHA